MTTERKKNPSNFSPSISSPSTHHCKSQITNGAPPPVVENGTDEEDEEDEEDKEAKSVWLA